MYPIHDTSRQNTLNAYADRYMDFCQAEEYVQCGLADTLMYKDEVISYLKQLSGRDEDDKLKQSFHRRYDKRQEKCAQMTKVENVNSRILCIR